MTIEKIKQFLDSLSPTGKIEYNNLSRVLSFDEAMSLQDDIYFLASVEDTKKRNGDKDIIAKNYFVVDFDIRENRYKLKSEIIDDQALMGTLEYIISVSEGTLFDNRRWLVNSWNWFHFYFTWIFPIDSYAEFVGWIYKQFEKIFTDPIFKIDHACKNIARITRLPWTQNYKRKKKRGLEPVMVEIITNIDRDIDTAPLLEKFMQEKVKKKADEEISKQMLRVKDDQLQAILQIPIEDLVYKYCWLELMPDKKNFKSPKDGSRVGMFIQDNVLYHTGTHYISDKYKWYNTFLFVKEHYQLQTNKATFDWFRNEYQELVDVKPKIATIELQDIIEIDFTHKLPFTRWLDELDWKFGKFDIHQFNVIIGESLSGKTEFTFFQARENAKTQKVVYLSLEMPPKNLLVRYAMKRAGISQIQRSNKDISEKQKEIMREFVAEVQRIQNLKILGAENPSIHDIIKIIEEYYIQWYKLFYIDNMGFILWQWEEIESTKEISRHLKVLTNRLPITVMLVHHFRKGTTKERKTTRGLADIRSSWKIENDADNVLQVRRNLSEGEMTDEERAEVKIILHKDRVFGQPSTMTVRFQKWQYLWKNPFKKNPVF